MLECCKQTTKKGTLADLSFQWNQDHHIDIFGQSIQFKRYSNIEFANKVQTLCITSEAK